MRRKERVKMRVEELPGSTWVTVKSAAWLRNGYPSSCVDGFGDIWLKPSLDGRRKPGTYETCQGEKVYLIRNGDELV